MSDKQQGHVAVPNGNRALIGPKKVLGLISRFGKVHQLEKYSAQPDIAGLKEDWQKLEKISGEPFCYYQSFDWCSRFVEHFAGSSAANHDPVPQIFVLRNRDTNEVVMILPLQLLSGPYGVRELVGLSSPLGQYTNLLHRPGAFDVELGRFVLNAITRSGVADALTLDHYPADCLLADIVGERGFETEAEQQSSILDLSQLENWQTFYETFSRNQKKQLTRRRRNLEALGTVSFRVYPADDKSFRNIVEQCLQLKRKWLIETGRRRGVLFDNRCIGFFSSLDHTFSEETHHQGAFAMALCIDEKPVALELGFAAGGDYYSYLGAIDLDYSKYSPGKLQIGEAQKWALKEGFRYFDFLNDPSAYKNEWSNLAAPLNSRSIALSLRGYIHCWVWKKQLKPRFKKLYRNSGKRSRKFATALYKLASNPGVGPRAT